MTSPRHEIGLVTVDVDADALRLVVSDRALDFRQVRFRIVQHAITPLAPGLRAIVDPAQQGTAPGLLPGTAPHPAPR